MSRRVRRVEVEFIRQGPRHNQLLSPLTDYLAMCGDFPGGVVHVPWEHAEVLNLLDDLRYEVSTVDTSDRLNVVRDRAGAQLATMLTAVPGLVGVLAADTPDANTITHVRLVMSAAELAVLPFELAKVPTGAGGVGDWLGLQPDRPVCITRHVRGTTFKQRLPTTPRILVVSGDDVPFAEHLDVFGRVLEPWRTDELVPTPGSPRRWTSEHLTVIERATLDEIRVAVAERDHSHVHVLAHGAEIEGRRSVRYGIALDGRVVTGGELALALAPGDAAGRLPVVVTLATCDSGAQGSVVMPGGSVAHDLHAAGIPLVVASQFPISERASIPFTEVFYRGQLDGEHPLVSLTEVRRVLATQHGDEHAWASVVVYEALPDDFERQLEEIHYWQSRRAHETALTRLENAALGDADFRAPSEDRLVELVAAVSAAADRLPTGGAFAAECGGLRAAGAKRSSEVAFRLSSAPDVDPARRDALLDACIADLESALELYRSSAADLLTTSDGTPQRKVTLHWLVGQIVLLQAILGLDVDGDLRGVVRWTARLDLDHPDPVVRAWALVSHIEQAVLQLATSGPDHQVAAEAERYARELVRALGDDSEHVMTTHRQMRRFEEWWGSERFTAALAHVGVERSVDWSADDGTVAVAARVAAVLVPPRRSGRGTGKAPVRAAPALLPSDRPPATTEDHVAGDCDAPSESRTGTFDVEMLPARNGDCLWITYGNDDETHHVMIDCGAVAAVDVASERVRSVERVELFILTHIDADHISGAIPLFEDLEVTSRIEEVWFNGFSQLRGFLSVPQGDAFSALLDRDDRPFRWNGIEPGTADHDRRVPPIATDGVRHPQIELPGGLRLTVLSPDHDGLRRLAQHWLAALDELDPRRSMLGRRPRPVPPADPSALDLAALAASGATKDTSVPNLSSIAVLAEYGGRAVLLTGDAHADTLTTAIRSLQADRDRDGQRLRLDALKLSHHGSATATTADLLAVIDCPRYLVSTDGSTFFHPDREAIARVVVHGGVEPTLYFNSRNDLNDFWGDDTLKTKYGYRTVHPTDAEGGLRVQL